MYMLALFALLLACPNKPGETGTLDGDQDGFTVQEDCDDGDAGVHPQASETPYDGVDNDCDPTTPDDDLDQDGARGDIDCDEGDPLVHPGATDDCDEADTDCDGTVDEDGWTLWYTDGDRDGYGDPMSSTGACQPPPGSSANGSDCDDGDPEVHPYALEVCDGVDQDCNALVDDEAIDARTWYGDGDLDGYGDPALPLAACAAPDGYEDDRYDCDDGDPAVNPSARESCDSIDNDCDGTTDEPDADGASTWHRDADGDGYGARGITTTACSAPEGYVADGTDCLDTDPAAHPGAAETWYDDVDQDCLGGDEDDVDLDGWDSTVVGGSDCDDGDPAVHEGTLEVLGDGVDQDCDGQPDGSPFRTMDTLSAEGITGPRMAVVEATGEVVMALLAGQVVSGGPHRNAGLFMVLDGSDFSAPPEPTQAFWFTDTTISLGEGDLGFDLYADEDHVILGNALTVSRREVLAMEAWNRSSGAITATYAEKSGASDFDHVEFSYDSTGLLHAVACDASNSELWWTWGAPAAYVLGTLTFETHTDATHDLSADACVLIPSLGYVVATNAADESLTYVSYDPTDGLEWVLTSTDWDLATYDVAAHQAGDWTVVAGASLTDGVFWEMYDSTGYDATGLLAGMALTVDTMVDEEGVAWVVATDGTSARLWYGDPTTLGTAVVTLETGLSTADDAAVAVTPDGLVVVAVSGDDTVVYSVLDRG